MLVNALYEARITFYGCIYVCCIGDISALDVTLVTQEKPVGSGVLS